MARPNQTSSRRRQLIPIIARAFAEVGYRRTTTAELARRCRVRENILYRLWPDKKAMFMAAIDYVFDLSAQTWDGVLKQSEGRRTSAERLLDYEAVHHGEFGLYRIIFAGLGESDDHDIRKALGKMYAHFRDFIERQVKAHRTAGAAARAPDPRIAAWAIIGLGTVANVGRELGLITGPARQRLMEQAGWCLLEGNRSQSKKT